MATAERKADTRRKIQLGGLIIKAGLDGEELAVLLGMLTAGARVLNAPNAMESRRRWKDSATACLDSAPSHEFLLADLALRLPRCGNVSFFWLPQIPGGRIRQVHPTHLGRGNTSEHPGRAEVTKRSGVRSYTSRAT